MGKLIIILVESAIELIPKSIAGHPSITNYAMSRGKRPREVLLDRTYHHFAMRSLSEAEKRGRPDIVHLTLLNALCSPLNRRGLMESFIHTREDKVIKVDPEVRLPRNYERFKGLIEQLYKFGRAPPDGKPLLEIEDSTLADLVRGLDASKVIGLSTLGSFRTLKDLCDEISKFPRSVLLVGGFPRGHFNKRILRLMDEVFRVYRETLDSWVIACRVTHQFELSSGIFF